MKKSKRILAGTALAMMIAAGARAEFAVSVDPENMITVLYGPPSMFDDPSSPVVPGTVPGGWIEVLYGPPSMFDDDPVMPDVPYADELPGGWVEVLYGPPPADVIPANVSPEVKTNKDGAIVYQDDAGGQGLSGKKNYLSNPGFEMRDASWRLFRLGSDMEMGILENDEYTLHGARMVFFRAQGENSAEMRLEQSLTNLPDGKYSFSIAGMGMNAGRQEVYAYVLVNGVLAAQAPIVISDLGVWDTGRVPEVFVSRKDTVTVGVYAKCSGADAWCAFDSAKLTRSEK